MVKCKTGNELSAPRSGHTVQEQTDHSPEHPQDTAPALCQTKLILELPLFTGDHHKEAQALAAGLADTTLQGDLHAQPQGGDMQCPSSTE